jgi:hypothetical protein
LSPVRIGRLISAWMLRTSAIADDPLYPFP